jgi:hypothetical protein
VSQAQSFANHCMYMASVVLESWRNAIAEESKPSSVLTASFGPAVRLHLLDAYGWQLLACNRVISMPTKPPHRAVDVPPLANGIAQSPEVTEMALLERSGWLADLQREIPPGLTPQTASGFIAVSSNVFDFDTARHCFGELESLMARVADAIDES